MKKKNREIFYYLAALGISVILGLFFFGGTLIKPPITTTTTTILPSLKEQSCINSGGTVYISKCCGATQFGTLYPTPDFIEYCSGMVGACGCNPLPEFSHDAKNCDCGEGKCWDGNICTTKTCPTIYCVWDPCPNNHLPDALGCINCASPCSILPTTTTIPSGIFPMVCDDGHCTNDANFNTKVTTYAKSLLTLNCHNNCNIVCSGGGYTIQSSVISYQGLLKNAYVECDTGGSQMVWRVVFSLDDGTIFPGMSSICFEVPYNQNAVCCLTPGMC